MTYTFKDYVLLATFIILAVDFGYHEKTKLVESARVKVNLIQEDDVGLPHSAEGDKVDKTDGADELYENDEADKAGKAEDVSQKSGLQQRRSAPPHVPIPVAVGIATAVKKFVDPDVIVPHDEEVETSNPGPNARREVSHHRVDENGKYIGPFDPDCSDTLVLTPMKKEVSLEFEHKLLHPGGTTCHWTVFGSEDCIPVVSCKKFHLLDGNGDKEDPCAEEFLEITDGSFGLERFCGKEAPDDITSGRKFRDFYLTLKLASVTMNRQFKCSVTCSPGKVHGKPVDENTEPEIDETCNCGLKPNSEVIFGGEDTKRGEFPWMASLVAAGTRKPFCGGSIINNRMILTAAHCFKGPHINAKSINILINAHKLNSTESRDHSAQGGKALSFAEQLSEQDKHDLSYRFSVDKYFVHPLYVRQTNDFDVAIIKLDKPIDFKTLTSVKPACIPQPNHYGESKEGVPAIVTGFGIDHNGATAHPVLQQLHVGVFTNEECKEYYGMRYTRRMLCAGDRAKDSCKGDSGGPLISEKTKQTWEQIGIVSFAEGCADKHQPAVYINTRQVSQWIRYISNMEEAVWCSDV